jgi:hypothetical protein
LKYKFTPIILVMMFLFFVAAAIKPEIMMTREKKAGQLDISYEQVRKYIRVFFAALALIQALIMIFFFVWVYR